MSHTTKDKEQEYSSSWNSLRKAVVSVELYITSYCRQGREDEGNVEQEATGDVSVRSVFTLVLLSAAITKHPQKKEHKGGRVCFSSQFQESPSLQGSHSGRNLMQLLISHPVKTERSESMHVHLTCFLLSQTA